MDQGRFGGLETLLRAEYGNIAGIVALRRGAKVYEGYFNGHSADDALHVFSVTKSVFSALIGIALGKGFIESVDQRVLSFFPDYSVPPGEETIRKITIENLLTMTAPYKYRTEPYEKFLASPDPIRDALDLLGGDGAIGKFNYSAIGGTHILSGILARAAGMPALDFASAQLFSPLGIGVSEHVVIRSEAEHLAVMRDRRERGWVADPQGNNTASWGLFLTAADMAKIGQLYLDGGTWEGQRILPASWLDESLREHSRCPEWGDLAYGYLWWIIDEDRFAALGDGGNVIYVNRKADAVIAIASLFAPEAKDRIELIRRHIEPLILD